MGYRIWVSKRIRIGEKLEILDEGLVLGEQIMGLEDSNSRGEDQ